MRPGGALQEACSTGPIHSLQAPPPAPQYPPLHPAEPQQCLSLSHQAAPHRSLVHAAGDVLIEVAVTAALLAVGPLGEGVLEGCEPGLRAALATSRVQMHTFPPPFQVCRQWLRHLSHTTP